MPYPTLAEELTAAQNSIEEKTSLPEVQITAVTFEGAADLPSQKRDEIVAWLEQIRCDSKSDCLEASLEEARDGLRQYGYMYAKVSARATVLSSDPEEERIAVAFVVSEGRPYRLEGIQIANAHVFSPGELRNLIPLQDGDVFNLHMVRKGLENLTRLYESQGYINFTADPDLRFDNAYGRISMVLDLQEGRQFRVGSVEILGQNQGDSEHALKIKLKPGDLFNPALINEFFSENKSLLPADISKEDTYITQNNRDSTVSILIDARDCPERASNSRHKLDDNR